MSEKRNIFQRLLEMFHGNMSEMGRHIADDPRLTWNWKKMGYIPANYALVVEELTKGEITAKEVLEERMVVLGTMKRNKVKAPMPIRNRV